MKSGITVGATICCSGGATGFGTSSLGATLPAGGRGGGGGGSGIVTRLYARTRRGDCAGKTTFHTATTTATPIAIACSAIDSGRAS